MKIKNIYALQDITISAFRYALPRHTYILSSTIDFLKENCEELISDRVKTVLLRDCQSQLEQYSRMKDIPNFYMIDIETIKLFYQWLTNYTPKGNIVDVKYHDMIGVSSDGRIY